MSSQKLSLEEVERCQETIIEFMPPPVTEKQQKVLENYRAGDVDAVRAVLALGSDYEECLYALLQAKQDDAATIDCLNEAVEYAVKFAGAADSSELYAMLGEIAPEQFG